MKMLLSAIVVLVLLVVPLGVTMHSIYAVVTPQATYESGFRIGQEDARQQNTTQWYILQYQQGFQFHSKLFIEAYLAGFCSVRPHTSSDADQASWDCDKGFDSAAWVEQPDD